MASVSFDSRAGFAGLLMGEELPHRDLRLIGLEGCGE
jgi:hypothetical protein